ncbi:MAG: SDR family oxidoreductase [Kineosporiaceae bacterium]|nr:SDR family oxidoreductase [Kineosporiaceae bacterium]
MVWAASGPGSSEHRVALVTGAARGIGASTVRSLAARGYRVVAVDACAGNGHGLPGVDYELATPDDLIDLQQQCGEDVVTAIADVRDVAQLRSIADQTVRRWGRLDVAVAAAAVIAGGKPLWEENTLEVLWQVDVLGVWNTAAVTVPHMLASEDPSGGRFIAVASSAGVRGIYRLAAYTTVKHAVVGLVRGLAADLVGTGVTAVAVCPGATRTRKLRATADIYGVPVEQLADAHLLKQLLHPTEVGETIAFCCSREARGLNGSVVALDGAGG